MRANILVLGTGSLASAFCCALATYKVNESLIVKIVGRSLAKAEQLATIANVRASLTSNSIKFFSGSIDWQSDKDILEKIKLDEPEIILNVSSLQSPWDFNHPSSWTNLVKAAGFGITLPLQAVLASKIARVIKSEGMQSIFINACYPDLVNPLLKALGLKVACGIGNISILAATLEAAFANQNDEQFKLLAHHYHVGSAHKSLDMQAYPRAWLGEHELSFEIINDLLIPIRNIKDASLNYITGLAAVKITLAFLQHDAVLLHVPGPNGLPGGYPVNVKNKKVMLALPDHFSFEDALSQNHYYSELDGIKFNDEKIEFSCNAQQQLEMHRFNYAHGFKVEIFEDVCTAMLELKAKLLVS